MTTCRKTHGVFSVRNWSLCTLVTGSILITMAIVLPHVINNIVDDKLCDQICIPRSTDDLTKRGNWLNNSNPDVNPEEIYRFYVFNITNGDQILQGAYPNVTKLGPYAYKLYREKFNVSWNEDESEIAYEYREQYIWLSDETGQGLNPNTDMVYTVNVPLVASWYLIQTSEFPDNAKQLSLSTVNGGVKNLITRRSAHDVIFYQPEPFLINTANTCFFTSDPFAPVQPPFDFGSYNDTQITELTPIFSHSTNEETAFAMRNNHNFGLGGVYKSRTFVLTTNHIVVPNFILRVSGAAPGNDTDVRIRQLTGHGSLSDVSTTTTYIGNRTFNFWKTPVTVTGHDSYQVQPFIKESDEIRIFDGLIYRDIQLSYQGKTSYRDIDMNHYYVDNLFDGYDPIYYSPNITGLFNASQIATIRFGVPTPMFVSRPYFAGADTNHTWIKHITCHNCPDMTNYDPEEYHIIVDIEPTIGKVLRGRKRAQTNILLGEPTIFGPESGIPPSQPGQPEILPFANVSLSLVPIVWFELSAEMDLGQSDMVKSGLSQIDMARTASTALLYGGSIGGALLVVFSVVLYMHYRRLVQQQSDDIHEREPMMNVAGPGDNVYTSTQSYRQH